MKEKKEEQMDKRMENKYRQWNGSRATIEYGKKLGNEVASKKLD